MPSEKPETKMSGRAHYDWKRYWCPRTGKLNLMDNGFLVQPTSEWRKALSEVVPYEDIDHFHFLGCLGEPGIGKTEELSFIANEKSKTPGCKVLKIDLERCRENDFVESAIAQSDTFKQWLAGSERLYIFLENLDRMLLPINHFTEDLESILRAAPLDRLYIRISCRTFDWSNILEIRMQRLFESCEVFELAPLTRRDVEIAANSEQLDGSKFISDVQSVDAVAFAIRPITLRFLLNRYMQTKELPSSTIQLYTDGCLLLCAESNPELQERLTQRHSAKQIFAAASRIAALMMFAQKAAIWDHSDDGAMPTEDIQLDDLVGGSENYEGLEVDITRDLINETLSCGLFSSRGPHRLAFAHQTYAEFLAASYLVHRRSSKTQILSLLVHSTSLEQSIVPQLTGVAAWLASMNQDVLKFMLEHDPTALLLADLERAAGEERRSLVTELLKLVEARGLPLYVVAQRYSKLNHPSLVEQIQPVIIDETVSDIVRHEALRIVEACQLSELTSPLLNVALDKSVACFVRAAAIKALEVVADKSSLQKLIPLIENDQPEDVEDEIKGAAMSALYPKCITTEKLFDSITQNKNDSLLGSYAYFLEYALFDRLTANDYPVALAWMRSFPKQPATTNYVRYRMEGFCEHIMWHAWEHANEQIILEAFARNALERLLVHEFIVGGTHGNAFREGLIENTELRRRLCQELIQLGSASTSPSQQVAFDLAPVPQPDDLEWLLKLRGSETNSRTRAIILELTQHVYRLSRTDHLEVIWSAIEDLDVKKAFEWLFKVIELDSQTANEQRARYQEQLQWQDQHAKPIEPPPQERVNIRLTQCESGHPQSWADLTTQLALELQAKAGDSVDPRNFDITTYAGWLIADTDTRKRIVGAAHDFLTSDLIDPKLSDCLASTTFTHLVLAGYKALVLLKNEDPQSYSQLSEQVWRRWCGATLLFPNEDKEEQKFQAEMAHDALRAISEEFISIIIARLRFEAKSYNWLPTARILKFIIDERLETALLRELQSRTFEASSSVLLLNIIADSKRAQSWVWEQISTSKSIENDEILILATARFLETWIDDRWDKFWEIALTNVEFGKRVFSEIANWDYPKDFLQKLSDNQLFDLYSWLWAQQSEEQELPTGMIARQTPQMMLWDFRTAIPNHLSQRNTESACATLEKMTVAFPSLIGIRRMLEDAKERLRKKTWVPCEPKYILELANNRRARIVRGEADLLNILIEIFQELQDDLQGYQSLARQIWNETPVGWMNNIFGLSTQKNEQNKKLYTPKPEAAFSDFVAGYLRGKFKSANHEIVINREVEIRSNPGGKGERPDIFVEAIAYPEDQVITKLITVVIEVKGNWHPEIETAMKTQLADQYLANAPTKSGIYLVGYFTCAQWNSNDTSRLKRAKKYSIEQLTALLNSQAQEVRSDGKNVQAVVLDASLKELPN